MLQFVYDNFRSVDLLLALFGSRGVLYIYRGWKQLPQVRGQTQLSTVQARPLVRHGSILLTCTFVLLMVCCVLAWFWQQSVETLLIGTGVGIIGFSAAWVLLERFVVKRSA